MSKQPLKKVSEKGRQRLAAASVCERLGLSGVNLLYSWKRKLLAQGGPAAESLEARVRQLEGELKRVERERDILKKALSIFGRDG